MSQVDHSKMLRNVSIASVVGATIEWYDFFLYGVVAGIVFNKLYFPSTDPLVQPCWLMLPLQSVSWHVL